MYMKANYPSLNWIDSNIYNQSMDISAQLQQQILDAVSDNTALQITGGNSKAFYGREMAQATPLPVAEHRGILDYQPTELTLTARAGTPLSEINLLLQEHGQMLPFEPPTYDGRATLGGTVAAAMSGPRRPWTGPVRDYVIGIHLLTGNGKQIRLGGKVMKNVAGYDLFRPMSGALGTLGLMLDITLKLLPLPETEASFCLAMDETGMQHSLREWTYNSLPLSAAMHDNGKLHIRLSGSATAVADATARLPAAAENINNDLWQQLNEQQLSFFDDSSPLYRLVVPMDAPCHTLAGDVLLDWGGALRWLKSPLDYDEVQEQAVALGGTAAVYRNGNRTEDVFSPLPAGVLELHKRLKQVMDPHGILNPGRLYRDL